MGDIRREETRSMAREKTESSKVLSFLADFYGLSHKELEVRAGLTPKSVSRYFQSPRIDRRVFERLLAALDCPPAAVSIAKECVEALEALGRAADLTPEQTAEIEATSRAVAGMVREALTEAVRLGRVPRREGYPEKEDLAASREQAADLWKRIEGLPEPVRLAAVQAAEELHTWALCELIGEESAKEASRDLERAASLARIAQEVAARVPGPESWRHRLQGFAAAHAANILRVKGKLREADAAFEDAKRLWHAGADPAAVLDPGRLLDLEASLRRDQRRFDEALDLLEKAMATSSSPARIAVKKGSTLEMMGEYASAIKALEHATELLEDQPEPRLSCMTLFNLTLNYSQVNRQAEATNLLGQVRKLAGNLGDEIFLLRVGWLEGRIAAGQGRLSEARFLLEVARRGFTEKLMWYDVALALLELAAIYLEQGSLGEVQDLAEELTGVFEAQGVHREALAALRLFQEAVQRDVATADLARRVLRYLFLARHDQGLRFSTS